MKVGFSMNREDFVDDYINLPTVICSFCGKNGREVAKLISGPDVYICNECIELSNDIIEEDKQNSDNYDIFGNRISEEMKTYKPKTLLFADFGDRKQITEDEYREMHPPKKKRKYKKKTKKNKKAA